MRKVRRQETENTDLDLAPMLSMIVALIPVLLLSFSFFQLSVVEAVLPQAASKKSASEKKNWKIELTLKKGGVIELRTKEGSRSVYRKVLPAKNRNYDLKGLHLEALELKRKNSEPLKVELRVVGDAPYEMVMQVMDEVRKDGGDWLFPDVVFADVFED